MMENVKALVSSKFHPLFSKWEQELASYGYNNYCQVLNAKDYGIPQNRERIFLVSILDDDRHFTFGSPFELQLRLKDMLEENADERYYLDDEKVAKFVEHCDRKQAEGCGFKFEPTVGGGVSENNNEQSRNEGMWLINGSGKDCASTLKTSNHRAGNITEPQGGRAEMGVFYEIYSQSAER